LPGQNLPRILFEAGLSGRDLKEKQMVHKTVLENGLRILTSPMPHAHSVSIGFFLGVGSRYETDEQGGVSHFIEHMLFKGTEKRPTAKDIAIAIEGIGGVFNASTSRELTMYWAKVAQPYLGVAVDVLVDMLLRARFDPEEIEKERRVIIEEINMIFDAPDDWVHVLINQLVWPDHPLGRGIIGTKESVGALDREALLAHLERHYGPTNCVISLAGNVKHEEVVVKLSSYLSSWPRGQVSPCEPARDDQAQPRLHVHYRDTEQAHLCFNVPALSRGHPDRFNLRVLNTVLGEGMSSRLFLEIREKRALAYSVVSYITALQDTGAAGIYAAVDPTRVQPAIQAMLGEWDRLRQERVSADELTKAKEFLKGRLMLQMEDTFSVAAWFGQQEILGPDVLTLDEAIARIEAATTEDIQRLARELFLQEKLNLAVVGPFESEEGFGDLLRL
jgi:predicted Zn-dependent peptidase